MFPSASSKRYHFVKTYFYGIKLLHANVQCVYNSVYSRYAKYQMASVKALYKLFSRACTIYRKPLIKKQNEKKWRSSKCCNFVIKSIFMASNFFMQMFNVSILCTQSIRMMVDACVLEVLFYAFEVVKYVTSFFFMNILP